MSLGFDSGFDSQFDSLHRMHAGANPYRNFHRSCIHIPLPAGMYQAGTYPSGYCGRPERLWLGPWVRDLGLGFRVGTSLRGDLTWSPDLGSAPRDLAGWDLGLGPRAGLSGRRG